MSLLHSLKATMAGLSSAKTRQVRSSRQRSHRLAGESSTKRMMGGLQKIRRERELGNLAVCNTRMIGFILVAACMIAAELGVARYFKGIQFDPYAIEAHVTERRLADFELAKNQSFGFFDDVSSTDWIGQKNKVQSMYPNTKNIQPSSLKRKRVIPSDFYQEHYEPDFACRHEKRLGEKGDGGKWVCDPHRIVKPNATVVTQEGQQASTSAAEKPCLIYSIGSCGDTSFERAIDEELGKNCEIHTFDMGNYKAVVEATGAHYHQWGLSHQNYVDARRQVFKTLEDTVKELGHVGRVIDVFKIDCEGCEWQLYPSFFTSGVDIRQVLIELHPVNMGGRLIMPTPHTVDFFQAMYNAGFVIFHKEVNIKHWMGQCIEYAFLKLHQDFFNGITHVS